ncbi:MAG: hypothetical protein ABSE89_07400 [Sedimentisphaerales bacterium]
MSKITAFLREHIWCLLVGIGIILLGVITFAWVGQDNAIVNYVSFASTVVSITLGIIVIIYSFIQNNSFQQNIYEMRSLIHGIREKTEAVGKGVEILGGKFDGLFQGPILPAQAKEAKDTIFLKFDEIFNIERCSGRTLTNLYILWCSLELKKPINFREVINKITEVEAKVSSDDNYWYSAGIFNVINSLKAVQWKYIDKRVGPTIQIERLPDNFQTAVQTEITKRTEKETKNVIHKMITAVDDYFASLL